MIPTLTKLFAISIVASNLLGLFNNFFTTKELLLSPFFSNLFGSIEKNATSDQEINAEHIIRQKITIKDNARFESEIV